MTREIKIIPFFTIALIASIAWFSRPEAIEIHSWHTLILFFVTLTPILFHFMPLGLLGLFSMTLFAMTFSSGAMTLEKAIGDALSGFRSELLWLFLAVFFIAKSFQKTLLCERVALWIIEYFGKRTIGLAYALALSDLFLAPFTPSSTMRSGIFVLPVATSISRLFGSYGHETSRHKLGAYLSACVSYSNDITGSLFLTACIANPFIVKFALDFGVELHWSSWFIAASIPAIITFFFIPIVLYFSLKPSIEETPKAASYAQQERLKLPSFSTTEKHLVVILTITLLLSFFSLFIPSLRVTIISFITLSMLLVSKILTYKDIVHEKTAWNTFIWLATLLMLLTFLNKFGFVRWCGNIFSELLQFTLSWHWMSTLLLLNAIYVYIHYLFVSVTIHVLILYGVFLSIGTALNIPPYPLVLLLGFSSSLCGTLTPFGHGRSLLVESSGFLSHYELYKSGFIISLLTQFIYGIVGLAWWKVIGLY